MARREFALCLQQELHHATLTSSFCCFYAGKFQFHRFPAFNLTFDGGECSPFHFLEDVDEFDAEPLGEGVLRRMKCLIAERLRVSLRWIK